jgi:hypothetical protein
MSANQERLLPARERITRHLYNICSWYENAYPGSAARLWHFPMVLLDKRRQ